MPTALMSKSTKGSRAAQSCDGCAAVWIDQLDAASVAAEERP